MTDAERQRRRREKVAEEQDMSSEGWLDNFEKLDEALLAMAWMMRKREHNEWATAVSEMRDRLWDIEPKARAAIWPDCKQNESELGTLHGEAREIAGSFGERSFTPSEFRTRWLAKYPARPRSSMLLADYRVNGSESTAHYPKFVRRVAPGRYRFIRRRKNSR
jgi:hypothetical protein